MSEPVKFYAAVAKVQTLADGGIRVALDLPEDAILAAAELMAHKRAGTVLEVTCTARSLTKLDSDQENAPMSGPDETAENTEGSGTQVDSRRRAIRRDQRAGG